MLRLARARRRRNYSPLVAHRFTDVLGFERNTRDSENAGSSARRIRPAYGWPTYTANLCPLCGRAEFASLGEDFGEPIRKSIEAPSRRAIWQGPPEHLDGMLSEEQRVDDAVQTGAGRNCRCFRLWGYMSRFRLGQMVLALQIIQCNIDIPHRHLWIGMTE